MRCEAKFAISTEPDENQWSVQISQLTADDIRSIIPEFQTDEPLKRVILQGILSFFRKIFSNPKPHFLKAIAAIQWTPLLRAVYDEGLYKLFLSNDRKPAITSEWSVDEYYATFEYLLTTFMSPGSSLMEELMGNPEIMNSCLATNMIPSSNWFSDYFSDDDSFPILPICSKLIEKMSNDDAKCSLYFSGNIILRKILNSYLIHETFGSTPNPEFQQLESMLFLNESITNADRIYICQMQIHENRRKDAIPVLEHVVSEELVNPISLVIWHKTFEVFLDDNVKSELHKSSMDCIVVPSVVYALYLLANVYSSLGDKDAYEETMKRFEQVRDFLGEDSPISEVLFTRVMRLGKVPSMEDFELD